MASASVAICVAESSRAWISSGVAPAVGAGATGTGVVRTSLGTVLGFSSLLFAQSPGLRDLGGIIVALLQTTADTWLLWVLMARRKG